MKLSIANTALPTLLVLLGSSGLVFSATGGEESTVLLAMIALSMASLAVGGMLVGLRVYQKRSPVPPAIGVLAILALLISVAVTHWPLRAAYALSRGAFDSVAVRIQAGETLALPMRVGFFTIRKANVSRHGVVCLWTNPDPSGNTGFVQCPGPEVPFNLWSIIRLDDGWQFISED